MSTATRMNDRVPEGTNRLASQIDGFLDTCEKPGSLSDLLETVAGQGELDDQLQQQIQELSRLVAATGDTSAEFKAVQRDADFTVTAAADGMVLELSAQPAVAGGKALSVEGILAWLKDHGVRLGVDVAAIRQACERLSAGREVHGVLIARGMPPTDGKPGAMEYYGRPTVVEPPAQLTPEQMRDPHFAWTCCEGDCIARCLPPQSGERGYDAWNRPLEPALPKPHALRPGRNVRQQDDAFYALESGLVTPRQDCLEVRKILVITSDVARQGSPLEFAGQIDVHAVVRSGAVIRALGDIRVEGAVEDATIESTNGNIFFRHGVVGRQRGFIRAKGNVETCFCEHVNIQAGGDIIVKKGAVQCNLTAGHGIFLNHGRGQIMGGVAVAGSIIEAKSIGAEGGTFTELIVGLTYEAMLKLAELDAQIGRLTDCLHSTSDLATRVQRAVGDPLKLQPADIKRYKELRRLELTLTLKLHILDVSRKTLLADSAKTQGGQVKILQTAFPNVVVHIGTASMRIKEILNACTLFYDDRKGRILSKG
jgi:uncharacterized protein